MATTITKYNSVIKTLGRTLPSWVNDEDDAVRVGAYDGYDDMYRNVPGTFAVVLRGEEDTPIYVPSAKRIVETTNRYLGKDWAWAIASADANAQLEITAALRRLFVREQMSTKFYSLKRNMVKLGDALLHITIDNSRAEGQRLSITEIQPRHYFPIANPVNAEQVIGCYIVNLMFADDGTTQIAQRLEYKYTDTGTVSTRMTFWQPDGWDDRWVGHPALKPVPTPQRYTEDPGLQPLLAGFELPSGVTTLPVYHFRNQREGGEPFGTSEIAGMETLIGAINQGVSDEDITLALQGLGVYTTTSTAPVNQDGEATDWVISPGSVLELKPGQTFERVDGVGSVVPYQEHLGYLGKVLDESGGLSAVAVGNVDVQVAQSGVALRLDMAPILAKNEEKESELLAVLDQFGYDLMTMWLPLDGQTAPADAVMINSFGDPLPVDRAAVIKEVTDLVTAGLMSKKFAVAYLTAKLGYQFPADMLDTILNEEDTVAARLAGEAAGGTANTTPPDPSGVGDISTGGTTAPATAGLGPSGAAPRPSATGVPTPAGP